MKKLAILALISGLGAVEAQAGEIFGTLSEGGKPVAAGVALKLSCSGAAVSAKTDAYGSYRLRGDVSGKCTLQAQFKNEAPSLDVVVYEKPARYDLVVSVKDGKYRMERK